MKRGYFKIVKIGTFQKSSTKLMQGNVKRTTKSLQLKKIGMRIGYGLKIKKGYCIKDKKG